MRQVRSLHPERRTGLVEGLVGLGTARPVKAWQGHFSRWCNWQHNWPWTSYWGFESSLGSEDRGTGSTPVTIEYQAMGAYGEEGTQTLYQCATGAQVP